MNTIGEAVKVFVRSDLSKGIMQDGTSGHQYRSKQYMRYKANAMRRFTRTTKTQARKKIKGFASNIKTKSELKRGGKLTRESGLKYGSVNTDVTKVNLMLTYEMIKSIVYKVHGETPNGNSITIGYAPEQAGKVIGNMNRGYNATGLRNENIDKVAAKFKKSVEDSLQGDIQNLVFNVP
jgi:hypothetical protein